MLPPSLPSAQKFCECEQDGWCQRYQREMSGRFRQICQGVNCDLGTAAAFREQWRREASAITRCSCWGTGSDGKPRPAFACPKCKGEGFVPITISIPQEPTPLLLHTDQAPGDAVVMTAAIYSLHKAHPGKYLTAVVSQYPEVFAHNPDVVNTDTFSGIPSKDVSVLSMHYPAIHESNTRGIHFMQGWCEFLGLALGVDVPLLTNRPHLYFSTLYPEPQVGSYWVICSGGKRDLTNKLWGHERYQEVVSILQETVRFVQVGEELKDHQPLKGVYKNLVGETNLRELFDVIRAARGVVCGVSLPMHVAAALNKPCIVIAGGREPVQWNAYPKQHYLHTIGSLPCSDPAGNGGVACWRSRVVPLGDNSVLDARPCERPMGNIPECMTMISAQEVCSLVLRYNKHYGD